MNKKEKQAEKINIKRHSMAHILATSVLEMFPDAKFGIGPATDDGFYYDFDLPRTLIPEDLEILEEKMRKIIKENYKFEMKEMEIDDAIKHFKEVNQLLKVELLENLKNNGESKVSVYKSGPLVDLCKGPHLDSTGEINSSAFKLTRISGAYWLGDENKQQLQRIYGVVFNDKKALKQYLFQQEEAKKRDHRKLGKELDLFVFSDLVGPGLPLFTPKGTALIDALQARVEKICKNYGFEKVLTPHLAKEELFITSGHAGKYGDENFKVISEKGHEFYLKPVQCPHQTQIYASRSRSYQDLPIRYMESNKQYRAEQSGEIGGLRRVYAITVEDGHSFCTPEQIRDEVKGMINIIKDFYTSIGLWDKFWVSLSVRGKENRDKYIGSEKNWDIAENMLADICKEMNLNATKMEGEAAIYGPKIDFQFKDAFGREIQIPTVQLDFATPERFELEYIDQNGDKKTPVMIHRAILGSYERFLVMLIESTGGKFPVWMAPVQVGILPVSEKFTDYAEEINSILEKSGIRTEMYDQDEGLGKRIALATKQKIPYLLILGEKEVNDKTVTIRQRGNKKQQTIAVSEFVEMLQGEIEEEK